MARRTETAYAIVTLTHHAMHAERAETERRGKKAKSSNLDCAAIGHAWTQDLEREGWRICIACSVVQPP